MLLSASFSYATLEHYNKRQQRRYDGRSLARFNLGLLSATNGSYPWPTRRTRRHTARSSKTDGSLDGRMTLRFVLKPILLVALPANPHSVY